MQGFKHMSSTENPKDMKLFAKNPQFLRSSFCFFFRVIFFFTFRLKVPCYFTREDLYIPEIRKPESQNHGKNKIKNQSKISIARYIYISQSIGERD